VKENNRTLVMTDRQERLCMAKKSEQVPAKVPGYRYQSPDVPLSAIFAE
jgi:hypothetical protein